MQKAIFDFVSEDNRGSIRQPSVVFPVKDETRHELSFPHNYGPKMRKYIHSLADTCELSHVTCLAKNTEEFSRCVVLSKNRQKNRLLAQKKGIVWIAVPTPRSTYPTSRPAFLYRQCQHDS